MSRSPQPATPAPKVPIPPPYPKTLVITEKRGLREIDREKQRQAA